MLKDKEVFNVGIYARLSKDDSEDSESMSISTQKTILTDYVKERGWKLVNTYVDDGYTGVNFQRPQFQAMIKDIEAGLIYGVITKDLSRLGRNYLDCGLYLEVFFPENNVRYIAVNDGVDTLSKPTMDITPFRNILNDMYSADVSMKVRSAYRARFNQGKFMGTTPPYGYIKDPADNNHLIIDECTAPVVRKMFNLALGGYGISKVRKWLNGQNILRPAAYAVEQGYSGFGRFFEDNEENRYIWSENSVRDILRNPVYAGHLTGYKRTAVNLKSRKRPSRLPEEWEIVRDTHEGIISQDVFDTVQSLITSRRGKNQSGYDNIFSGIIKCADCGYHLSAASANRRKRPELIDCIVYWCGNYTRYGNINCSSHTIEARDLHEAVFADINYYANLAMQDPKALKTIQKKLNDMEDSEAKAYKREQRRLTKRLAELDKLYSALYEDKVMKRISERNFITMGERYEKEQIDIETRLREIDAGLSVKGISDKGVNNFFNLVSNYQGLTELTAATINTLIDKITVSERRKNKDGVSEQRITIYYKFVGTLQELNIPKTKRVSHISEKPCARCGTEFKPNSNVALYCPACREIVKREHAVKSNEARKAKRNAQKAGCAVDISSSESRIVTGFAEASLGV